ncbi:MAG TPA: type II secretion system F family protein [Gemmatimonadaceae bacterium]|nr:type II secretion system F family protein [Gemmatimonadaceae bacterium]
MSTFAYRAVDPRGSRRSGRAVATTRLQLVESLTADGLIVLEVSESDAPFTTSRGVRSHRKPLIDVTRSIAGLLSAGLPLTRALTTARSMAPPPYRECLDQIGRSVSRGESLATAMAAHPNLFPPFYLGLVRAGERSAELPTTFNRLVEQLERDDDLRSRLGAAAIYPALLAIVGSAAILVLMLFVLPRFAAVLEGAGARLPRSTQLLVTIATAARIHWLAFLSPIGSVPLIVAWTTTTERGAHAWAELQLRLPGLRTFRRDILAARFARLMSVLLAGGAPVLGALDTAAASLADPVAGATLVRVRAQVREGVRLSVALRETALFPSVLMQLVALGEETGRLHEFLRKAADLFEQRSQRALARLVALAEPLMIVLLALVVGSVALSLLQAIYGVNASAFR